MSPQPSTDPEQRSLARYTEAKQLHEAYCSDQPWFAPRTDAQCKELRESESLTKAEASYREALELQRESAASQTEGTAEWCATSRNMSAAYSQLTLLYLLKRDRERATAAAEQALAIAQAVHAADATARAGLVTLSMAWFRSAEIDQLSGAMESAREKLQRSLELDRQLGDRSGVAATRARLEYLSGGRAPVPSASNPKRPVLVFCASYLLCVAGVLALAVRVFGIEVGRTLSAVGVTRDEVYALVGASITAPLAALAMTVMVVSRMAIAAIERKRFRWAPLFWTGWGLSVAVTCLTWILQARLFAWPAALRWYGAIGQPFVLTYGLVAPALAYAGASAVAKPFFDGEREG